jgi:hypothetical protein
LAFKHESLGGADAPLKWLGFSARDDGVEVQNASRVSHQNYLVGGLEYVLFFHIMGIIIPTDFHIFQRGRSTTNHT